MAREIPQAAAIPFRRTERGDLQVLLIRWKDKEKWGVPKGLIDPGNTAEETAEIESMEEAGISGELLPTEVGDFTYEKFGGTCGVKVFILRVTKEHSDYREAGHRIRKWFELDDAVKRVDRDALKVMIGKLPKVLA